MTDKPHKLICIQIFKNITKSFSATREGKGTDL
jgi:hypothetical protein